MKEINFGVITDSPSPRVTYELNKKFYHEAKKHFRKIYYINLNNLIKGRVKKSPNSEIKFISRVFETYTPKNYYDLDQYLKKKNFIFSVSLGKDFKYFKIWYILKKRKHKLFYHLNLGILSTKKNFYTRNFLSNLIDRLKKIFLVNISFKLYRYLVLFRIFPNIDYIFESSKLFKNNFVNSPAKKIEKFFGVRNIALYQKIIHINSRAYDEVIDEIKDIDEKYITFLDSGFDHPDRERFDKKATESQRKDYYQDLKKILLRFSKIYRKKIIFCSHPKSNLRVIKKHLKNIKVIKYKTRFYILRSKIIFFHESSSALDAMILKKKLWSLKSKTMGKFFESRNNLYPNMINCPSSEMSDLLKIETNKIKKIIENYNFKFFNNKIINYLVKNQQSLNYINKCISNKKMFKQNKNTIFGRKEVLHFLKKEIMR